MPMSRQSSATPRIRLLAAIGSLGTGGSEKQLVELLVRIPRERFDPHLLVLDERASANAHVERLRAAGIPVISIRGSGGAPPWRWLRLAPRYVRAIDRIQPDLVYAWLDETAAYLAPICRAKRIPCVVARRNLIGSMTERHHGGLGRVIRLAEARATLVTANSRAVAANSASRGHDPALIRLVPNGHAHLGPLPVAPSPPTVFGYVAQFRSEKGHHRLIDALALMAPGPWRVDLAGTGRLRPEIEERVKELGLEERVDFVGEIDDVRGFWCDRHVAILLSDSEGSPNALIEAAFAGRPAIATRTGGNPEVIGDGGVLVGLDEPDAVTAAMAALVADGDRREALGRAIWQHASEAFSIETMLAGHLDAIEEAYERGPHPGRRNVRGRR
jgi:L-malate glycosyltransferase